MNAGAEQPLLAQGNLFDTPLCHLALYVYRHAQTGTLQLVLADGSQALLRVQRGRIAGARLPWPAQKLLDGLLPLCGLREGQFAFFEGDALAGAEDALIGMVDPYELLAASLEDFARDDMVDAVLRRFSGKRLRLSQGRDIDRLRLRPEHRPLVDLIRAEPATADELVAQAPLAPERARRVLYALLATNMVTTHVDRETGTFHSQIEPRSVRPGSPPSTPAAPVRPRSSQSMPAASVRPRSSQSMPVVAARPNSSPITPAASVRPGSSPSTPAAAGGGSGSPPGSESSSAWQRLASLRPASAPQTASFSQNSMMPATPRSGRPPSAPLLAPDDKLARQRRAEQLLQRGKPEEALTDIEALLALEPERAEWLGLRAQALFEKHQFEKEIELEGVPRVVLDAIKKALEVDSEQPRALYTKGMIFKRTGEMKKAVICWKRALRADPKNLEAGREFRLAKLRTESQG